MKRIKTIETKGVERGLWQRLRLALRNERRGFHSLNEQRAYEQRQRYNKARVSMGLPPNHGF